MIEKYFSLSVCLKIRNKKLFDSEKLEENLKTVR